MKQVALLVLSIFLLNACKNQQTSSNSNTKVKEDYSIVGDWYRSIEPGVHAFLEDGTYHIHLPGEDTEKGEVVIRGEWWIKGDELTTKHDDGHKESKTIHWITKDQFFLGDYNPEIHTSSDEDGMYSRAQE